MTSGFYAIYTEVQQLVPGESDLDFSLFPSTPNHHPEQHSTSYVAGTKVLRISKKPPQLLAPLQNLLQRHFNTTQIQPTLMLFIAYFAESY